MDERPLVSDTIGDSDGVRCVDTAMVNALENPENYEAMLKPAVIGAAIAACVMMVTCLSGVEQFSPAVESLMRAVIGNANILSNAYGSYCLDKGQNKRLRAYVDTQIFMFVLAQILVEGLSIAGKQGFIEYNPHRKEGAIGATLSAHLDSYAAYARDLAHCIREHGLREGVKQWLGTPYIMGSLLGTIAFGPADAFFRSVHGDLSSATSVVVEATFAAGVEPAGGAFAHAVAGRLSKKKTAAQALT